VDSAVVRVTPRDEPVVGAEEEKAFSEFVQAAFGQRRKQLRRVLRGIASLDAEGSDRVLASLGIDSTLRPESLTPAQFAAVFRATR
jgi:16S rRNA (adenine1518-N6/adenine1519-N6)-dimethyltransferase